MKHIHLKGNKDNRIIKAFIIICIFFSSTLLTFNYLNKNIYNYNTREYLDLFTKLSFSFETNMDLVINKLFDFYDKYTNTEVVNR